MIKPNTQIKMNKKYDIQIFSNREENLLILKNIEETLLSRRGFIFRPPKGERVVILASGGLDSTVTMDIIIREWGVKVYPLFIRRKARATAFEEKAFDYFMKFYKKRFPDNLMKPYKIEMEVPPLSLKKYKFKKQLSVLGHPMRNATLQNIATQYATKLESITNENINTILTSTVGDDTFPHSSLLALRIENLAVCVDSGNWNKQVTSPLIDNQLPNRPFYKKDLILYAQKYKIPLEHTRTCIESTAIPDGTCNECLCRLRAFEAAGVTDPIKYLNK
ncbi:MAG: 7-cyano-7-deazaguanine synthase [Nanoarchaeota archaeon]|nr:7-cyano-7-deazaguanine synthase [Nanoarchaeota archaeon]